jgi:two-component system cell cycle sensor histidine kinase/response regulator CckA
VIVIDLKGKIRVTSRVAEEMLGYQKAELRGKDIGSILPTLADINTTAILHGNSSSHEMTWHSRSGQRFEVSVSVSTITDLLDNAPVGIVYAAYDITRRRQAEEAVQASEEKLRLLVDNAYEGILVAREGMLLYVNPQAIQISGYSYEELTSRPFLEFVYPDDRPLVLGRHVKRMKGEIDPEEVYSYRIVRKDGTIRWLEMKGAMSTWDKKPANLNFISDITERKQAEEALRQSKETLQRIMDGSSAVIFAKDLEGKYIFINTLFEKLFHISNSEILGKTDYDIFPRETANAFRDVDLHAINAGSPIEAEEAVPQDDGMHYYISLKFPLYDSNKKPYAVCGMATDITERKRLGEQTLKSQKLESIGTLAGGIAHDFNNLLQGVFGYISLAKMTANDTEKSTAALEQAEKALHQTINLTTQLLTFSKGGKPFKKQIDLRPIIENSAKFMLSGSRSDLRLNITEDLWQVEADEGQIGQVIQNIVLNADQSMPTGGTVRVTAANMAKGDASLPPGLAQGDYVMIAIRDTGAGIPDHYLSKIFDPYFTTKEKGSGLGLATSYSIVKNHGGMIDVITKYGKETTFVIYLPAIIGRVRTESEDKEHKLSPSGKARVLVMDDEEVIRNLSSELLCVLGHDVEVAKHGQEAVEKYRSAIAAGRPFDIVILDLTIRGGMGGVETLHQLLKMDPHVKAVVSSGYSDDMTIANYMSQGFKACLKKPYDIVALREVLSKMINN